MCPGGYELQLPALSLRTLAFLKGSGAAAVSLSRKATQSLQGTFLTSSMRMSLASCTFKLPNENRLVQRLLYASFPGPFEGLRGRSSKTQKGFAAGAGWPDVRPHYDASSSGMPHARPSSMACRDQGSSGQRVEVCKCCWVSGVLRALGPPKTKWKQELNGAGLVEVLHVAALDGVEKACCRMIGACGHVVLKRNVQDFSTG